MKRLGIFVALLLPILLILIPRFGFAPELF
jgi:hypothetical protein